MYSHFVKNFEDLLEPQEVRIYVHFLIAKGVLVPVECEKIKTIFPEQQPVDHNILCCFDLQHDVD